MLFSMMGINVLGAREIAAVRDDKNQMSIVFSKLLGTNCCFTLFVIVIYIISFLYISKFNVAQELFLIGIAKILFSTFLVEWLYTGIEKFKYITIRTLIIKLIYVILVLVLVRKPSDYVIYFLLTIGTVVVNAVINIIYAKNFVNILFKSLFSIKYAIQCVTLGVYNIMSSLYMTFNVMCLGILSTNEQVGYYTVSFKIYSIVLSVFAAFTDVMLPRMSSIIAKGNKSLFNLMTSKSISLLCTISIPIMYYGICMAPQLISIFAGAGYEPSIIPMRIIFLAILPVGIAYIIAKQFLLPLKKERILLIASLFGGFIAIIMNILFVKKYYSIGSSIVLLASEITVTLVYLIYIKKKSMMTIDYIAIVRIMIKSIPIIFICILSTSITSIPYMSLIISALGSVLAFVLIFKKNIKEVFKSNI